MTSASDPWLFFDKIYCISIDQRTDRRKEAKKQFASVGLLERVEFVLVTKHSDNPEQGIFLSHMHCLQKGVEAGARHILVFEDDIFFQRFNPDLLHKATTFLNSLSSWNAFFLGGITTRMKKCEEPAVARIQYRCLAHAYALNASFARQLIQEPWAAIPFDDLLRRKCQDFFALSPMIAFQGKASTDNQTFAIDRMRRLFGGLPFIQKTNELYQLHKMVIVCSHFLLLAALILSAFILGGTL